MTEEYTPGDKIAINTIFNETDNYTNVAAYINNLTSPAVVSNVNSAYTSNITHNIMSTGVSYDEERNGRDEHGD